MTCNYSCPYEHRVTSLVQGSAAVEMTVTNSTNISSLERFELILCVNPDTIVTGSPLPYNITINGTAGVPLLNRYSLPIYSNRLRTRRKYHGTFVNNGSSSWIILHDTPCCPAYATSGV